MLAQKDLAHISREVCFRLGTQAPIALPLRIATSCGAVSNQGLIVSLAATLVSSMLMDGKVQALGFASLRLSRSMNARVSNTTIGARRV
jgi:hypothetical protein